MSDYKEYHEVLTSKIYKCYYDRFKMDLENYEFDFIVSMKEKADRYSKPVYGNGITKTSTDEYIDCSEKQSNWFEYLYSYKGLLNEPKKK